jgi:predicted nucleotidyltransferase
VKHLTSAQVDALRSLTALWGDTRWCLIGASALGCHLDMRWRGTGDLDLVLAVDEGTFPAGLDTLEGWRRDRVKEHEWHGPGWVQVDVLPAGPEVLARGHVQWNSGIQMSLVGMRLAFAHAAPVFVAPGVDVEVAPLHVIALLKMVAYQESPGSRERDLADLAYIMEEYVPLDSDRLWSEVPTGVAFECRPAFLLGLDLAPLLNERERVVVTKFIALLRGVGADTTRPRFLRGGPSRWRADDDDEEARLDGVIDAFEAGLSGRPQ